MKFFLAAVLFAVVAYAAAQAQEDADQERVTCFNDHYVVLFASVTFVQDIQKCMAESTGVDEINGKLEDLDKLVKEAQASWKAIQENDESGLKCYEKLAEVAKEVRQQTVEIQNDIIANGDEAAVACVEPHVKRTVDKIDAALVC